MRTQRAEVLEAGEGDGPDVLGVDNVATIELGEEPALDTWVGERSTTSNRELTKRLPVNQLPKANITAVAILSVS